MGGWYWVGTQKLVVGLRAYATLGAVVGDGGGLPASFLLLADSFPSHLALGADVARAVELLERLQRSGELPPQKLQALQRVLQSKFCSAIREVRPRDPPPLPPQPPCTAFCPLLTTQHSHICPHAASFPPF